MGLQLHPGVGLISDSPYSCSAAPAPLELCMAAVFCNQWYKMTAVPTGAMQHWQHHLSTNGGKSLCAVPGVVTTPELSIQCTLSLLSTVLLVCCKQNWNCEIQQETTIKNPRLPQSKMHCTLWFSRAFSNIFLASAFDNPTCTGITVPWIQWVSLE